MPFTFEDRTGQLSGSDYDDIYDRMFIRVTSSPHSTTGNNISLALYVMGRRSTRHADMRHLERHPSVVLEFGGPSLGLGTIHFLQPPAASISIPINNYLRKTALFGGSLSRKFRASDGQEYRWQHKSIDGHEWSCLSEENYLIAHYDLRPPNVATYGVSGNTLTVYEAFSHLCIDIFASLTIMRYIAEHRL
ncbi:hypothetical protein PAXINDRAFT_80156 [Paxillus involutus ATCC 200175]|uniref:Unplaced genomic scaffold PAXINscaffold_25, whole genome shotgun sequence n=1 Tax=Paxillus involutus ATCC 200175 TaxID=664439 RepID=A0A0C9SWF5_PAXIN|nr:hypothetical protein PAXINDRAFT_80156 [Paxillus involutus ATCC 200175]